jgi:hypothetical protein
VDEIYAAARRCAHAVAWTRLASGTSPLSTDALLQARPSLNVSVTNVCLVRHASASSQPHLLRHIVRAGSHAMFPWALHRRNASSQFFLQMVLFGLPCGTFLGSWIVDESLSGRLPGSSGRGVGPGKGLGRGSGSGKDRPGCASAKLCIEIISSAAKNVLIIIGSPSQAFSLHATVAQFYRGTIENGRLFRAWLYPAKCLSTAR